MSTISVFSERGWNDVYHIRAAVNTGDAQLFSSLAADLHYDTAVQVTMIGETLLRQAFGDDPTPATLAGAAAVLTPHLRLLLGVPDLEPRDATDLIRTCLRLRACPAWAQVATSMMFFCGFLAPLDDADFLDFRLRCEPLWAKAIEDHLR